MNLFKLVHQSLLKYPNYCLLLKECCYTSAKSTQSRSAALPEVSGSTVGVHGVQINAPSWVIKEMVNQHWGLIWMPHGVPQGPSLGPLDIFNCPHLPQLILRVLWVTKINIWGRTAQMIASHSFALKDPCSCWCQFVLYLTFSKFFIYGVIWWHLWKKSAVV